MQKLSFVDLFSGVGGLSKGFVDARFEQIFAVDIDKDAYSTYKQNFPNHTVINKDVAELKKLELLQLTKNKRVDVVIGGPPCQGFSMAGNIGRQFTDDPRNHLFKEFVRVVKILNPKYVVMENVARLETHNKGKTKLEIISEFNKIGYLVESKILCSVDYEVPQVRNRVFFIGNRVGIKNIFPKKNNKKHITVKEAINDLPKLKSGEEDLTILNHKAMNHKEQMLKKMSYIQDGGDRTHIPKSIRPKTGDPRKYIKYNSEKPSICITGDMRKVFHYSQNRALTVRELARIQTFPDKFEFTGSSISQQQQVGDAVPPKFGEAIANVIKEMEKCQHTPK